MSSELTLLIGPSLNWLSSLLVQALKAKTARTAVIMPLSLPSAPALQADRARARLSVAAVESVMIEGSQGVDGGGWGEGSRLQLNSASCGGGGQRFPPVDPAFQPDLFRP